MQVMRWLRRETQLTIPAWSAARMVISAAVFAVLITVLAFTNPAWARVSPTQPADPPECIKVNIVDNSGNGPTLFTEFCGTGSEGISPLLTALASKGPLVMDGGPISPSACTATVRCFVVWPLSPQTGP